MKTPKKNIFLSSEKCYSYFLKPTDIKANIDMITKINGLPDFLLEISIGSFKEDSLDLFFNDFFLFKSLELSFLSKYLELSFSLSLWLSFSLSLWLSSSKKL